MPGFGCLLLPAAGEGPCPGTEIMSSSKVISCSEQSKNKGGGVNAWDSCEPGGEVDLGRPVGEMLGRGPWNIPLYPLLDPAVSPQSPGNAWRASLCAEGQDHQ